ncbi:MAG: hypothetical protein S4CHLAM20_00510 [Chlamydiia bacterium]|nr:hypothetical protein [Chlamydiia bacterium]
MKIKKGTPMADSGTNGTYYSYKSLLSYMNCFDPNDNTKYASFQSGSNVKVVITIPAVAVCGLDATPNYAYYKTPTAEMMSTFASGIESLNDLGATVPDTIKNFSVSQNIVNLDDTAPCAETKASVAIESPMDIASSAMMASGANVEFWQSKYALLGLLTLIKEKVVADTSNSTYIFSLSWGTYGICDSLSTDVKHEKGIGQSCDKITKGCPSNKTSCSLTNAQYIESCETYLKDLTENHNCIFFVSSGDTGPISNKGFTHLPYYVDYPTSSKYCISAGGVNYTAQAPADQQTSNPTAYQFAKTLSQNGLGNIKVPPQVLQQIQTAKSSDSGITIGMSEPLSATDRATTVPDMTIGGKFDAYTSPNQQLGIMATGGGFTGYQSNDTLQIKARDSQKKFLNEYVANNPMPDGYKNDSDWNTDAPQRGIPDISACMSNAISITWNEDSNSSSEYMFNNADGTSLSAPLLAGFFALLLSYKSLPSNTQLIDFIYANPDCFDKPQTSAQNSFQNYKEKTVNGFTSTTAQGTWDPCVGLGVPNFLKLYDALSKK